MIMNSYRGSYQGTVQDQKDIYEWIEKHQAEPAPYKAPGMVRDAIHAFYPPPAPAHFVAPVFADGHVAMYSILLWMQRTNYPAAVMINGNHWVVISGYETDVAPEGNSSVVLHSIDINDPMPFCAPT